MTQTPTRPTSQSAQGLNAAMVLAQPQYEISNADKDRQKAIAAAWDAYNGLLVPPLQKMPGQPDDNVLSNRCQAVVDRGVDFLFGKELEISIADDAPDEAQTVLDQVWGRKEARIPLLQKLAMNGAIAGQAFLRIVPERNGTLRLIAVDPATVFVQTAPQDCDTVLLYCIEYSSMERRDGKPAQIFYREEISRIDPDQDGDDGDPFADVDASWQVQHWSRAGDRGPWQAAGEPIIWPYPFPPIFSCQNLPMPNSFWGKPDITPDLIGLNEALNLVQSNVNRVQKLYGQPIIYATGTGESVIDIKPGRIIGLPLTESKIVAVPLPNDTANALAFAGNLRSDIDELSGIPGVAMGRIDTPARGMSGIAIELLFMPLLKKTDKKQCLYGEIIIDVSKAILILNRISHAIEMTLAWQSPLPSDDLPTVQAALMKQQISISNTTLQRELGYDPEQELALSQTEDAQKLLAFSRGQGMPTADLAAGQQSPPAQGAGDGQEPQTGGVM